MDMEISYTFADAAEFWEELRDLVSSPDIATDTDIASITRQYLNLIRIFKDKFLTADNDVEMCITTFRESAFFKTNQEQIHARLADDQKDKQVDIFIRALGAHLLILEGSLQEERTLFKSLQEKRLLPHLIASFMETNDLAFYHIFTQLMYEMTRIQPLTCEDLMNIDTAFLDKVLVGVHEELSQMDSNHGTDEDEMGASYSFALLLVLNEQYLHYNTSRDRKPIKNSVVVYLAGYTGFNLLGNDILRILNRESRADRQVQLLQLLYSIFQYQGTAQKIYTNDIRVLLDILINNLFDMPYNSEDAYNNRLRHLRLRVLQVVFENSQLKQDSSPYNPALVFRVISYLTGEQNIGWSSTIALPSTSSSTSANPGASATNNNPPSSSSSTSSPPPAPSRGLAPPTPPHRHGSPLPAVAKPVPPPIVVPASVPTAAASVIPPPPSPCFPPPSVVSGSGGCPPLPPPRRGGFAARKRAQLAAPSGTKLKPPPPPPPRSHSRPRTPIQADKKQSGPNAFSRSVDCLPLEPSCSHFESFDPKTRELAIRCLEAYRTMYPIHSNQE